MKRFHVHVGVENLPQAIGFYSTLFATKPAVVKPDYAKWMLDDPRVNFAISTRGKQPGLDHLGIQVESKNELHEVYDRLHEAGGTVIEQGQVTCCYAHGEKAWIDDPSGIAWEAFFTTGESTVYGDGTGENGARIARAKPSQAVAPTAVEPASACCASEAAARTAQPASACCAANERRS